MKLLKSVSLFLIALMVALLLSVPALAMEDELLEEQDPRPVAVCSLEELLTAIESADNDDTIIVQHKIEIIENCTIGQEEKRVTIIPASDFEDETIFEIWPWEEQSIVLQNIVLDGQSKSALSAIEVNFYGAPNSKGTIHLTNTQVRNFISTHSNVYINNIFAIIDDCQFLDNVAERTAGVEISKNATGKISDCIFSGNSSLGNGGALRCQGQVQIESTTITQNQAFNPDSAVMGGGIYISEQGYCEITACQISDNTAFLGGGIVNSGSAAIIDTVLCKNQGLNGASDIMTFSSKECTVTYSDEMKSVYSENDPIGFYLDNMDNRFNVESNAVFLGESLAGDISMNQYGARFIFATDLPQEPPKESENPDEQEPSTEPKESDTPDTSEPPVAPDESDEDITVPTAPPTPPVPPTPPSPPTISKPTQPTVQEPPVIQPEEVPELKLSHGGVTLDTTMPFVLLGYGDGLPHENDPITRAQLVVLLYRSLTDNSKAHIVGTSVFADVVAGAWYYDAVVVLSSAGIVNGCDGLFCPNDTLTLGQLIAIFTRFIEPKEAPMPDTLSYVGHWAYGNIVTAVAYGWIDNAEEIEPDRPITRGEAVEIVNSIFEKL